MAQAAVADTPDKAPPPALLQLVSGGGTGLPSDAPPVNLPATPSAAPTTAAPADVSPTLAGGADWSDETGQFKARVSQLLAAMPPELRQQAEVISGFRTAAQQQDAWQRYQSGAGGLAAPPGMSRHEKGLAADWSFKSPAAQQWMHDNAGKFGLTFPFGSEDPNHMQMTGPPTGGTQTVVPTLTVPATGAGPIIAAAKERQQEAFAAADREQQLVQAAIARIGTTGRTADQQKELVEARAKADAAVDRATKLVEHPPEMQQRDLFERMGGLATVIGILGGLATRRPFMGSMNAAASAIEAYNAGDMRKYQMDRENWKTQSDLLFKIAEINNKRASDILTDQRMDETEKTAQLNALFSAAGADASIAMLREKGTGAVQDALQGQFDAAQKHADLVEQEKIAHNNKLDLAEMGHPEVAIFRNTVADAERQLGRPLTPEEQSQALAKAKSTIPAEFQYPESWEGMPEKHPPGTRQDLWDMALSFVRTGQMPAMGFAPSIRPMVVALEPAARYSLGIKPSEVADVRAQYAGERHAEVLLGGRTANLGMALNEAQQFVPLGDAASAKVDRTQYPNLNSIYEAVLKGTGDENVIRLVMATNAITNAYAQVAARGGQSTDAARAQGREILENAFSKGQYAVAVDQMMKEVIRAQNAPAATQGDILKAFSARWNATDAPPKHYIGEVITTKKGDRVYVTGGKLDSDDPEVEPVER